MTDTSAATSPATGPHLTPMFDTGPLPSAGPMTDPTPAPIFDTGPHPDPLRSQSPGDALLPADTGPPAAAAGPVAINAAPVTVPGSRAVVKRWHFLLITLGVWAAGAAAGAGLYFWWYSALYKTAPVFAVLLYLVACMVASLLVSMVTDRPRITALAIAVMSAPLASTAAAALLHGAYYFEWIARPTLG